MLEMGRGLTHDEEVSHFGLWCMMSSPLLIGCDLTKIPAETMKILTNRRLIAINQDPLGRQAYVAKRCPKAKIMWVTPWRGSNADVVEYFNGVIKSIKKVCKKHRVPVLDASQTVIDPSSADFRKAYFQSETDNAHLNNRGHDLFLPIGEKFILDHLNH